MGHDPFRNKISKYSDNNGIIVMHHVFLNQSIFLFSYLYD